jgi:hypothetical protein
VVDRDASPDPPNVRETFGANADAISFYTAPGFLEPTMPSNEELAARIEDIDRRISAAIGPLLDLAIKMQTNEETASRFAGMIAGYQIALMAVVRKLDEAAVLPASEAKAAIDGAYATLTDANKKAGQGTVLRQLSQFLEPRRQRH